MRRLAFLGLLLLLAATGASAEIVVSIVSMATEVYDFDPVYVLFSVTNSGVSPVYLPAEASAERGFQLYVGRAGKELRQMPGATALRTTPFPLRTLWLSPGESWYFYQNVARSIAGQEGEVLVQAVLSSMGRCGDDQIGGRSSFPLEPLRIDTFQLSPEGRTWGVYRCWKGEARSEPRSVWVRKSSDPKDLEAMAYVQDDSRWPAPIDERVRGSKTWPRGLDTFFRDSRYTFAYLSRSGSGIHTWLQALELQPNNPLAPWVRGAVAMRALDYQSSCWDQKRQPFDRSGRRPPSYDPSQLPAGVPELLDQYRWYLENRHCPRVLREAKKRHD